MAESFYFEIKQEVLPWQEILPGLSSGKYDLINAAFKITKKRAKAVSFTMPTTELTHYYLKRKGDNSVNGIQDIKGKAVAAQEGRVSLAVVREELKPELKKNGKQVGNVKTYGAFTEAYQDLKNERVDVVINNIVALTQVVKKYPELYEIGKQIGPKSYAAWAVRKGDKQMLDFLNEFLSGLRASGKIQKIQEEWLGIYFDNFPDQPVLPGSQSLP
jgi:polar amino acid transport system substrate-binding protein